jgi:hypothetical protein
MIGRRTKRAFAAKRAQGISVGDANAGECSEGCPRYLRSHLACHLPVDRHGIERV